ncbi:MAG: carbohydrate ABC transporter permease [Alphaproteobacteria bacterium]
MTSVGVVRPVPARAAGRFAPATFGQRRRLFLLALGLPSLLYVLLVAVVPLAQGMWLSLFDYNLLRPARREFVGIDNYLEMAADPVVRETLWNTLVFTVLAVAIEFVLGLALALLLWRDSLFNRVALALMLVPVALTPLVVGLVFRALLTADFGMIGYFAADWGLSGERGFFGYPNSAMGALIFIDIWQWTPLVALILLAGLKSLPHDAIEAADVAGASPWQKLRLVILPMLLPAIFLALVLRTMDAFRIFDSVFVTTKGGPDNATNVLMFHAVKQGLEFFNIGDASALSNLMLVCIGLIAGGFVLVIRRADRRMMG